MQSRHNIYTHVVLSINNKRWEDRQADVQTEELQNQQQHASYLSIVNVPFVHSEKFQSSVCWKTTHGSVDLEELWPALCFVRSITHPSTHRATVPTARGTAPWTTISHSALPRGEGVFCHTLAILWHLWALIGLIGLLLTPTLSSWAEQQGEGTPHIQDRATATMTAGTGRVRITKFSLNSIPVSLKLPLTLNKVPEESIGMFNRLINF